MQICIRTHTHQHEDTRTSTWGHMHKNTMYTKNQPPSDPGSEKGLHTTSRTRYLVPSTSLFSQVWGHMHICIRTHAYTVWGHTLEKHEDTRSDGMRTQVKKVHTSTCGHMHKHACSYSRKVSMRTQDRNVRKYGSKHKDTKHGSWGQSVYILRTVGLHLEDRLNNATVLMFLTCVLTL